MSAPFGAKSPGQAQAVRLLILLILVLVLQIPSLFMSSLVSERRQRRDAAAAEIASKWGAQQTLTGPALVVPWKKRRTVSDGQGRLVERVSERRLVLLPESLRVTAKLETETRRRGIYGVPVYRLDARIEGRFARPDFAKLQVLPEDVDWSRAVLSLGISDARAIQEQVVLDWNGRAIEFQPGAGDAPELGGGIHAELGLAGEPWGQPFTAPLRLNGTRGVYFTPFGRQTTVELSGAWPDPSFQGQWLPAERSVTASGFRAAWSIPALGRNFPQAWTDLPRAAAAVPSAADDAGRVAAEPPPGAALEPGPAIARSAFGLDLVPAIDSYRLCDRTLKYALLFVVLTFTAFWLLEVLGGRPLHPIQYLMIGAALVMFLLLELALSEHVGFGVAYAIASALVVGLIVHYAASVLASRARALGVGGGLALLYAFHYVVLRNEDYALLLGSLLFFGALAAVMSATRRVDWYAGERPGPGV